MMVRIGMCVSCQFGDHSGHQRVVQAVPKGVLGGVICGCKGECDGKPTKSVKRQIDHITQVMRSASLPKGKSND